MTDIIDQFFSGSNGFKQISKSDKSIGNSFNNMYLKLSITFSKFRNIQINKCKIISFFSVSFESSFTACQRYFAL